MYDRFGFNSGTNNATAKRAVKIRFTVIAKL